MTSVEPTYAAILAQVASMTAGKKAIDALVVAYRLQLADEKGLLPCGCKASERWGCTGKNVVGFTMDLGPCEVFYIHRRLTEAEQAKAAEAA
jgi:hypothetical protein